MSIARIKEIASSINGFILLTFRINDCLFKIPEVLLNREKELCEIKKFISNGLKPQSTTISRVLYISGVPGTGKTASVLKVYSHLFNN